MFDEIVLSTSLMNQVISLDETAGEESLHTDHSQYLDVAPYTPPLSPATAELFLTIMLTSTDSKQFIAQFLVTSLLSFPEPFCFGNPPLIA